MKKIFVLIMLAILVLSMSACAKVERPQDCKVLESTTKCVERLSAPVSQIGLIVQIDGFGSQEAFGDPVVGRKIIVRDDLSPNVNGWYTREIVEIASLSQLNISEMDIPFLVEFERDYSQARRAWQPYFSMNVDSRVSIAKIEEFLSSNHEVVPTSVVLRLDKDGKKQECSLRGLDPLAVRYVLYSGENITFQTCDPNWSKPY